MRYAPQSTPAVMRRTRMNSVPPGHAVAREAHDIIAVSPHESKNCQSVRDVLAPPSRPHPSGPRPQLVKTSKRNTPPSFCPKRIRGEPGECIAKSISGGKLTEYQSSLLGVGCLRVGPNADVLGLSDPRLNGEVHVSEPPGLSTHVVPHATCPAGHEIVQALALQI
jgi:hypothetical protein